MCARRPLRSRLLGGVPGIGGVRPGAALVDLCVQLGRTLEVNAVEDLKRGESDTEHLNTTTTR